MSEGHFDHVPEPYRAKVAADLLNHLTDGGRLWNWAIFNSHNDYQRHLYALFLRIAGRGEVEVQREIEALSDDVQPHKRGRYAYEVVHSSIVGFPQSDGSLIPIPSQVA